MSEYQLLQEFKDQILKFLDELIEQFPRQPEFVIIRIFVKDQIPVADVLGRFIVEVLPFKNLIKDRNQDVFLNSDAISNAISGSSSDTEDNVNQLKKLWSSSQLDDQDRLTIWRWMDLFIRLSERYYKKYGFVQGWEVDLDLATELVQKKYSK